MRLQPLHTTPTADDIRQAHEAILRLIHRTPVMQSAYFNKLAGGSLYFKCENFQKVGAFKMRGAASAALRLPEEALQKGLCTHSSGNHAQAVARAAQQLGVPAYIVMPKGAPAVKQNATRDYGAHIIFCENTLESRENTLAGVMKKTGASFIHPYDNYDVIAGQATAAKELLEEIPDLDMVIAPVGGGGLMSGTALSCHYFNPSIRVFGAEPLDVTARPSLRGGLQTWTAEAHIRGRAATKASMEAAQSQWVADPLADPFLPEDAR